MTQMGQQHLQGQWIQTPDIRKWLNCKHRLINYHITQYLSGHGCFKTYAIKMGKTETEQCTYCEQL